MTALDKYLLLDFGAKYSETTAMGDRSKMVATAVELKSGGDKALGSISEKIVQAAEDFDFEKILKPADEQEEASKSGYAR